jgi:hypothetical protein
VLLQALRAAAGNLEHPHDSAADGEHAADGSRPALVTSTGLADALLVIAEAFLAGKITAADNPEVYWMIHDHDGTVLDLGRRRRRPTSAQRRAARERDHCRCRYPGCESRRTDLHHIRYWSNGGRTSLDNLISLCKRHHMLVHDRDYLIAAGPGGTFTFYQPDGTPLPSKTNAKHRTRTAPPPNPPATARPR